MSEEYTNNGKKRGYTPLSSHRGRLNEQARDAGLLPAFIRRAELPVNATRRHVQCIPTGWVRPCGDVERWHFNFLRRIAALSTPGRSVERCTTSLAAGRVG